MRSNASLRAARLSAPPARYWRARSRAAESESRTIGSDGGGVCPERAGARKVRTKPSSSRMPCNLWTGQGRMRPTMVFGRHRCKTEMLGHEIWKGLYARRGRTGAAASTGPTQCSRGMKPSHIFHGSIRVPLELAARRVRRCWLLAAGGLADDAYRNRRDGLRQLELETVAPTQGRARRGRGGGISAESAHCFPRTLRLLLDLHARLAGRGIEPTPVFCRTAMVENDARDGRGVGQRDG